MRVFYDFTNKKKATSSWISAHLFFIITLPQKTKPMSLVFLEKSVLPLLNSETVHIIKCSRDVFNCYLSHFIVSVSGFLIYRIKEIYIMLRIPEKKKLGFDLSSKQREK